MPAMTLRSALRTAIGTRNFNECAEKAGIGRQQLKNLVDGKTEPWEVKVVTAQRLVEAFPFHLQMAFFYQGRSEVSNQP